MRTPSQTSNFYYTRFVSYSCEKAYLFYMMSLCNSNSLSIDRHVLFKDGVVLCYYYLAHDATSVRLMGVVFYLSFSLVFIGFLLLVWAMV